MREHELDTQAKKDARRYLVSGMSQLDIIPVIEKQYMVSYQTASGLVFEVAQEHGVEGSVTDGRE